ncbi:hypothetical protein J4468_03740 [Candidatus Woesearchaeota archaeon]|nr:hypothetical protein [Candidatus Woesearchaeota archaeon]
MTKIIDFDKGKFILEDVKCMLGGRLIEDYKHLEVARKYSMMHGNKPLVKPYYLWIEDTEKENQFIPSFGLMCNIQKVMFEALRNFYFHNAAEEFLLNFMSGIPLAHNTLVSLNIGGIANYAHGKDIIFSSGRDKKVLYFKKNNLKGMSLERAIKNEESFIRNITLLDEPEILIKIGNYFNMTSNLVFDWPAKKELDGQYFTVTIGAKIRAGGYNLVPYLGMTDRMGAISVKQIP